MPLSPSRKALTFVAPAFLAIIAMTIAAPRAVAAEKAELAVAWAADVNRQVDSSYVTLENLYKHLHLNPELSSQEERTSAYLARQLGGTGP